MNDRRTEAAPAPDQRRLTKTSHAGRLAPRIAGIIAVVVVVGVALIAAVVPRLLPADAAFDDETRKAAAAVIFAASYLALLPEGLIPGR